MQQSGGSIHSATHQCTNGFAYGPQRLGPGMVTSATPWSTGNIEDDEWLRARQVGPDVLKDLGMLQPAARQRMLGSVKNQPNIKNVQQYLIKCLRNHMTAGGPAMPPDVGRPPARPCQSEHGCPRAAPRPMDSNWIGPRVNGCASSQTVTEVTASQVSELRLVQQPPQSIPVWIGSAARELFQEQRTGMFIQTCVNQLNQTLQSQVMALPPTYLYQLCFSLLISRKEWADPDQYVRQCLATLAMLEKGEQSRESIPLAPPTVHKVDLVLVHNCVGVGTSHLVWCSILPKINRLEPHHNVSVVANYSFEINSDCLSVEHRLCERLNSTVQYMGDVHGLPELVLSQRDVWSQNNFKVVFMNSWPCKDTSKANKRNRVPGSGLHMKHSRAMWPIVQAMAHLGGYVLAGDFLHITEYPQCRFQEEDDVIDQFFGPPLELRTSRYRTAARTRNIRFSPLEGRDAWQCYFGPINPFGEIDGWVWLGESDPATDDGVVFPTVVLRSYLTKMAEQLVLSPQVVTDAERSNMLRIRVQHRETKEVRWAGRHWWCLWLGMASTPMAKILDELFPCHGHIWTATGACCKDRHPNTSPCGRARYCNMCEKALDMLGQAWNFLAMADITLNIMQKALDKWVGNQDMPWTPLPMPPIHQCREGCECLGNEC